jgi:hypothetical protein
MKPLPFVVLALVAGSVAAGTPEPGLMLRTGNWTGDVGTYSVPAALLQRKAQQWPRDQWYHFQLNDATIDSQAVAAGKQRPAFLQSIVSQLEDPAAALAAWEKQGGDIDPGNAFYLRVPGATLRQGPIELLRFDNGTASFQPILDHHYRLTLGGQEFGLTVSNGLRNQQGAAYGQGAHIVVSYDGKQFDYLLGEFGWEATIRAVADLDGDGKPDFLISVGGNNSAYEAVLLSTRAKPGRNPATASLTATGC